MDLKDYLDLLDQSKIQALEKRLGRHRYYLRRIGSKLRRPSPTVAWQIEKFTDGKVRRWELRPDIWDAPESEVQPPVPVKTNGSKRKTRIA